MIAPHQVPARQASAATRQMQPAPAAPAAQPVAQPQPAAAQPAQPPHPTAGGPVAVLHDGAKLHFPPGTPPEGMDAGVQHHLAGRAQGAKDAQNGQQAMMLQILQQLLAAVVTNNQIMQQIMQAQASQSGRTAGAVGAAVDRLVQALSAPKSIIRDDGGRPIGLQHTPANTAPELTPVNNLNFGA